MKEIVEELEATHDLIGPSIISVKDPAPFLVDEFWEAELRLEKVVCLSMESSWHSLSDNTQEFLEEFEDVAKNIDLEIGWAEEFLEEDDYESLAQEIFIRGYADVFAKFSHPVIEKGKSYGWGMYTSKWFYGKDLKSVAGLALDWANASLEQIDSDKK